MAKEGTGLQEIDAGSNACSVEWCPIAGLESYVACSTYLLEDAPDTHADAADETPTPTAAGAAGQETAVEVEVEGEEAKAGAGKVQTRSGTIVVHKLAFNTPASSSPSSSPTATDGNDAPKSSARLQEAARVSLDGGVLDAKWCQQPVALGSSGAASALLACATSTGRLGLYTLSVADADADADAGEDVGGSPRLQHSSSSDADDSLLLSLDWSGGGIADAKIVVSQSDGALAIWRPHPNGGAPVQEVAPWHAHTLRGGLPTEAWISFFRKHGSGSGSGCGGQDEAGTSFVVSGADDALMKGWDLRVGGGACGAPPAFVCKDHGAGVTAGQWHPTREHTFASGSYDESVRIWDARALGRPVSAFTTPTGGGLWRLKWHPDPDRGNLLLAACMHAGMRVLDTGTGIEGGAIEGGGAVGGKDIVAKFTRHASMAYGADWCRLPTLLRTPQAVIASCSFYDSLFCLWETPPLWF